MKIIVCIKQVPKLEQVTFDPKTNNLVRDGVEGVLNPPDRYAIEAALQCREQVGGQVTVITMGPSQAEKALKEACAMGCDTAILLSDRQFAGADTLATAQVLAAAIRKLGVWDLVICGSHSIDADTGHVGPQVAELLDVPQITSVESFNLADEAVSIMVNRRIEHGRQTLRVALPAVVSMIPGCSKPRYANAIALMKAARVPVTIWSNDDLCLSSESIGQTGSPTSVTRLFQAEQTKQVTMFTGSVNESVKQLIAALNLKQYLA